MRCLLRTSRGGVFLAAAATIASLSGCGKTSARPGDPLLDAVRAEERGTGDLTYAESQGKHLFLSYCATCHGDDGHGDGQNASNLTPPPPDLRASKNLGDATYARKVIAQGSASVGRSPLSPPWGRNLSSQELDYLVAYCQSINRSK